MEGQSYVPSDFIATVSGKMIDPDNVTAEDIDIVDIAVGLGNLCRYSGQLIRFHSVAEHSVLVSNMVTEVQGRNLRLKALLHDAPEFIINDLVRPIKRRVTGYDEIESSVMDAVAQRFGLEYSEEDWAEIKRCDDLITVIERRDLSPRIGSAMYSETGGVIPGFRSPVGMYAPHKAFSLFLIEFYKLTGEALTEAQTEVVDWLQKEAPRYV